MTALWTKIKSFFLGTWGRVAAAAGALLAGIDGLDITPVKEPLTNLIGQKGVSALIAGLFGLAYWRHQQASNKVKNLQAQIDVLKGVAMTQSKPSS